MGITNPSMYKFLKFQFELDFHDCKIDQNRHCFVAYISESVSNEQTDKLKNYWLNEGIEISFLRIKDEQRN